MPKQPFFEKKRSMDSLIHSVAQRMIVGMRGERFYDLLGTGIAGFIAFAPDVADLSPAMLKQRLAMLQATRMAGSAPLWLAVDQEGGPVERLTPDQCPSLPSFNAMARLGPEAVHQAVGQQAAALASLGFNLNFTPCMDVNTEASNPVIGVRSFGGDPATVSQCAAAAVSACLAKGILPVGKHFPGHGGGVVDSHEALPTLPLSAQHLAPFHALIHHPDTPLPAVMMAHGVFPGACESSTTPASLSERVIQGLLRQQMRFDGLVITDDLQMGALSGLPEDIAIQAMAAGNDVLLYREAGEREWAVLHAVVKALQTGRLSIRDHQAALERIAHAKSLIGESHEPPLDHKATALHWAEKVLNSQHRPPLLQGFTLLQPHTSDLHGYRSTPPEALVQALTAVGLPPAEVASYSPLQTLPPCPPGQVLFVASHLTRCSHQHEMARQIRAAGGVVVTTGWLADDLPGIIQLPGYQPDALQAMAEWFALSLKKT